MEFTNKTVIVTGAANGIGKGVARLYAEKGATVILADLDEESGNKAASAIEEKGGKAAFVLTDVRKELDIVFLMKTAYDKYGHIDILINNAGKGLFKSPYESQLRNGTMLSIPI